MHVLIIPSEHYVTRQMPLGAIFQHQQAHALKKVGIKIGVISAGFVPFKMLLHKYYYFHEECDEGVTTYRKYKKVFLPGRIASQLFYKDIVDLYLELYEKYIRFRGKPDLIHAHNCLYAGEAARAIKNAYGVPYVLTEHSSAFARRMIPYRQKRIISEILKNADVKTAVSTSLGRWLENEFKESARPQYPIFNILDHCFERIPNTPKNEKQRKKSFVYLSIGNLDLNKNQIDLLHAFSLNFQNDAEIQLRIGGDGPTRKQLEAKAKELGIENHVVFMGHLDRERVYGEMQNCQAFVLTSLYETFGVVLIEALASGKPVIATQCGGPEDIVNRNNGILVPIKNVKALAEAMRNIRGKIDQFDAKQIRNDCLSRFGSTAFTERIISFYKIALDKKDLSIK